MSTKRTLLPSVLGALLAASCATGGTHEHAAPPGADARIAVRFPEPLRMHTLANMRDHLATLQQIQEALAKAQYDRAAEISERRLGLSSLEAHGAHDVARYMPAAMQEMGTGMHKAASRFGIAAANAGASGDLKGALEALAAVTAQCVACHAAYRLE
jgi:cytochrome c556